MVSSNNYSNEQITELEKKAKKNNYDAQLKLGDYYANMPFSNDVWNKCEHYYLLATKGRYKDSCHKLVSLYKVILIRELSLRDQINITKFNNTLVLAHKWNDFGYKEKMINNDEYKKTSSELNKMKITADELKLNKIVKKNFLVRTSKKYLIISIIILLLLMSILIFILASNEFKINGQYLKYVITLIVLIVIMIAITIFQIWVIVKNYRLTKKSK